MSFAGAYLERVSLDPAIERVAPNGSLGLVVAIPACNEPDLLRTLRALRACTPPEVDVEVIVALNSAASAGADVLRQNRVSAAEIADFAREYGKDRFRILYIHRSGISDRDAGAGTARKLAMDHALSRFNRLDRPGGVILSFDADTLCEPDYLSAVNTHFRLYPDTTACSVYFEHPLEGGEYPERVYKGITQYELHLRYYIEGLRHAGHPHAYHTVGSAFCVRAGIYAAQGGMNRRKAGEDFYFLQKIIPLGHYHELNSTCLTPSPRPSGRVAFGTGPVVEKFLSGRSEFLESYDPRAFYDLKEFIGSVPGMYRMNDRDLAGLQNSWPLSIRRNLEGEFQERFSEIRKNSARPETFTRRFFRWFNMFRTLKFLNFANREIYSPLPVRDAAYEFLRQTGETGRPPRGEADLLKEYRRIQRSRDWQL